MSSYDFYAEHELLTPTQERELGLRVMQGDLVAWDRLVRCNLRLVLFMAECFYEKNRNRSSIQFDDLVSVGVDGLMEAARRFDPDKGAKFSSYAMWWIKQRMRKLVIENDGPMRIPMSVGKNKYGLKAFIETYKEKHGHYPDMDEICAKFPDLTRSRLKALTLVLNTTYLDAPIVQGEADSTMELVEDSTAAQPGSVITGETRDEIKRLMVCLKEREREVIIMRFGLDGAGIRTLEEVSDIIGLTRERIRQIQKRAIEKMQALRRSTEKI